MGSGAYRIFVLSSPKFLSLFLSKEVSELTLSNYVIFQQRKITSPLHKPKAGKTYMVIFVRSLMKEKAILACKVLISAKGFPIFIITFMISRYL